MIVVDASVVLDVVLMQTEGANALERRLLRPRQRLLCPHLLDAGVA